MTYDDMYSQRLDDIVIIPIFRYFFASEMVQQTNNWLLDCKKVYIKEIFLYICTRILILLRKSKQNIGNRLQIISYLCYEQYS